LLIRFRLENHRSIRDEQELSFVAASLNDSPERVLHTNLPSVDLLRVIGIYGANASGKSTVLDGLRFMQSAVIDSQRTWEPEGGIPRKPFLLDKTKSSEPSLFEVDILLDGIRYTYGFSIDSKIVIEEWLYAYPQGRKQEWFTRDASEKKVFKFSRLLTGANKSIEALTRPNSLFLSAAAQNNHKMLRPIFKWFTSALILGEIDKNVRQHHTVKMLEKSKFRTAILEIIQGADLGISNINVQAVEIPELSKKMLNVLFAESPDMLDKLNKDSTIPQIWLLHQAKEPGNEIPIPFSDESRGTEALFELAGYIVEALESGGVLCVDELDTSLHPLLALEIIKIFNDRKRNPHNAQLLFNTHDTNILESGELRRDQIWFTEKDSSGATCLYPLTDYKARKEENLKRGYLQGRYGAVPYIQTPAKLVNGGGDGKS